MLTTVQLNNPTDQTQHILGQAVRMQGASAMAYPPYPLDPFQSLNQPTYPTPVQSNIGVANPSYQSLEQSKFLETNSTMAYALNPRGTPQQPLDPPQYLASLQQSDIVTIQPQPTNFKESGEDTKGRVLGRRREREKIKKEEEDEKVEGEEEEEEEEEDSLCGECCKECCDLICCQWNCGLRMLYAC